MSFDYWPADSRKWVIHTWSRIVSSLPQLAELELYWDGDMPQIISQCLLDSGVHNLRKLVLHTSGKTLPSSFGGFSTFIARNPNLSHITLSASYSRFDIAVLTQRMPFERPLKLQHLSIGSNCKNLEALVPHLQLLQSFKFRLHSRSVENPNGWCPVFCKANVFPSAIEVDVLDSELIMYLTHHPGVVSLTIRHKGDSERYDALSEALAQHSEKLRFLALDSCALSKLLTSAQNRVNFLKCTGIEEFALIAANPPAPAPSLWSIRYVSTQVRRTHVHIFIRGVGEIGPPYHRSPQPFVDGGYQV